MPMEHKALSLVEAQGMAMGLFALLAAFLLARFLSVQSWKTMLAREA
jgi:hypothetical protein